MVFSCLLGCHFWFLWGCYVQACMRIKVELRLLEDSSDYPHATIARRPCVWDGAEARQQVPDARVAAQGALLQPLAQHTSMHWKMCAQPVSTSSDCNVLSLLVGIASHGGAHTVTVRVALKAAKGPRKRRPAHELHASVNARWRRRQTARPSAGSRSTRTSPRAYLATPHCTGCATAACR